MKVAVLGAGAVGGYFGARLARAGVEVTLIARGAHLQAIRERGLEVRSASGSWLVRVSATDDPAEVGPVDLVLVCVKSYDTEQAAAACVPLLGPSTSVLTLQNGVDNEEKLARVLGPQRILGGVAYIGVEVLKPGVILHHARGDILVGELQGPPSPRVKAIQELFLQAGVSCEAVDDIQARKWEKFLFNCALNPITALTRRRLGSLLQVPESRALFERAVREAERVARLHGVALAPDIVDRVMATAYSMDIGSSMQADLEQGRKLELEAFNGYVIRLGQLYGVPTPVNDVLYGLLKPAAPGTKPESPR